MIIVKKIDVVCYYNKIFLAIVFFCRRLKESFLIKICLFSVVVVIVVVVVVNVSHFHPLQNHWANSNQFWHKAYSSQSLFKGEMI